MGGAWEQDKPAGFLSSFIPAIPQWWICLLLGQNGHPGACFILSVNSAFPTTREHSVSKVLRLTKRGERGVHLWLYLPCWDGSSEPTGKKSKFFSMASESFRHPLPTPIVLVPTAVS